ncbi:MAG: Uma2 family endonuclease, partial [Thermoguttaceae bacterium]
EAYTEELGIPIQSGGSTTLKNKLKQRGLEPDECYYIAHEPAVRGLDEIDLTVNPPPDLAIEVDISSSSLDQLEVYASLGLPEVWICDGEHIKIHLLSDGAYVSQDRSSALPSLFPETVLSFLRKRHDTDETSWIKSFRQWVREKNAS